MSLDLIVESRDLMSQQLCTSAFGLDIRAIKHLLYDVVSRNGVFSHNSCLFAQSSSSFSLSQRDLGSKTNHFRHS
jgi:hypothetical protein